jgi:hypothetical protein
MLFGLFVLCPRDGRFLGGILFVVVRAENAVWRLVRRPPLVLGRDEGLSAREVSSRVFLMSFCVAAVFFPSCRSQRLAQRQVAVERACRTPSLEGGGHAPRAQVPCREDKSICSGCFLCVEVVLSPSCVELLDGSDALVEGRSLEDEFLRSRGGVVSSVVFVATRADGEQVGEDRADAILWPLSKTLPKSSVLILVPSVEFWSPASVPGIICLIIFLVPGGVDFLIFFVPA